MIFTNILFVLACLALGAFAGFLSGLLGLGGGTVVVPGLVLLLTARGLPTDHLMQVVTGTSLAVMIATTARSLRAHLKHKLEFVSIYRRLLPGVFIGVFVGAFVAHSVHSRVLGILFACFLLVMAWRTWQINSATTCYGRLPGSAKLWGVGLLIGGKSGLLGIGGGAITIPFLVHCQVDVRRAVLVSVAIGLTVALLGTVAFIVNGLGQANLPHYSVGYVYLPPLLPLLLGTLLVAPLGARCSHALPTATLQRIFAIFLVIVAVHMLSTFLFI